MMFSTDSPCLTCAELSLVDVHSQYKQKTKLIDSIRHPAPKPSMVNISFEYSPIVCCVLLLGSVLVTVVLVFVGWLFLVPSVIILSVSGVLCSNITDIVCAFC